MLNILKRRKDLIAPEIVINQLGEQYIVLQKIYKNRNALLKDEDDIRKDVKDALTQTYPIAIKKRNNKKRSRMTPAIVSYHFNTCILQYFLVTMERKDSTDAIKLSLIQDANNILQQADNVNRVIKRTFEDNSPFKN